MEDSWNVIATSKFLNERTLIRQLSPFGRFRRTGFRDVLAGAVEDTQKFLESLEDEAERFPLNLSALSKAVPIDSAFEFTPEDFMEKAKEAVRPYLDRIGDAKFFTRIERRGLKGALDSLKAEQELGGYIHEELKKAGKKPGTDFKDPDVIVVIETLGGQAGAALITREMKKRFRFLKIR